MTTRAKERAEAKVRRKYPMAGVELSAMHGFRVMDYVNPEDRCPPVLGPGARTEAEAWRKAARRLAPRAARKGRK